MEEGFSWTFQSVICLVNQMKCYQTILNTMLHSNLNRRTNKHQWHSFVFLWICTEPHRPIPVERFPYKLKVFSNTSPKREAIGFILEHGSSLIERGNFHLSLCDTENMLCKNQYREYAYTQQETHNNISPLSICNIFSFWQKSSVLFTWDDNNKRYKLHELEVLILYRK